MNFRSLIAAAASLAMIPAANLFAQDAVQQPDVSNSKFHFSGVINASTSFVRSGPGDGYYPTEKLAKGAAVTVVGIRFDWLKIQPPEGSFSYVGSVFIDRAGDGSVGRINRNDVNIRAGSELNAMKTTVQTRLNLGDTVQVVGQEDEYLKIKPPQGAYLYINKQFVDPVKPMPAAETPDTGATASNTGNGFSTAVVTTTPPAPATAAPANTPPQPLIAAAQQPAAPTTQPTDQVASGAAPATQPSASAAPPQPSAEELFAKYEDQFVELSKQPLLDQKISDVITGYQSIAKSLELSDTLKEAVQLRVATLQARSESQAKLIAAKKIEKENAEKQVALQAEQQELQERLKQTDVQIFEAVGTLRASSLQVGAGTLYRLTDPATGRTVIYIRSNDPKITGLLGQFIGVKGDPQTDPQLSLRVITPTDAQAVDPDKVNGSIAAEIMPPSLLAKQASASTSN
jgi:hypothetical protein